MLIASQLHSVGDASLREVAFETGVDVPPAVDLDYALTPVDEVKAMAMAPTLPRRVPRISRGGSVPPRRG